ncbi:MAG: Uncharacterized protein CEO21_75 [Microgenomates group bacterium Gr01-1014_80]|nr:MAG: Uncharacterized protein CEO21_75 [Microgenomates group bacterium Gr01-1014_80]
MANHQCQALVVTCIDFRFQEYINDWISKNLPPKSYDRVAFAGCVKNFETILEQIRVSKKLHGIHKVILINHEDCGAYGEEGTPEKHVRDLTEAAQKIKSEFPDLEVESFYLHLDGTFER